MHKSIIRTKDEVQQHMNFIQNEIDTRIGTYKNLSEEIPVLRAIYNACYAALNLPDFDPSLTSSNTSTLSDKYYLDTCLWLQGKLHTAPNYKPLREAQYSTEQIIEDFGKTSYTSFVIS